MIVMDRLRLILQGKISSTKRVLQKLMEYVIRSRASLLKPFEER